MRRIVGRLMRAQGHVLSLRAPHIFLVPIAADLESRNFRRVQVRFDGHVLPELHITGLSEKDLRRGQLGHPRGFRCAGKVDVREKEVELVFFRTLCDIGLLRFKLLHIVEAIGLAEGAIMEEIVAQPDVGHGRLRADGLDRRMRIDSGHHG
jgi:hypothetical protein